MSTLIPENAQSFRKLRIGALAVAYFRPLVVNLARFGGAYAGTAYFVALFPGVGAAPIRMRAEADPDAVLARIQALHAATGAPIAAAQPGAAEPFAFR